MGEVASRKLGRGKILRSDQCHSRRYGLLKTNKRNRKKKGRKIFLLHLAIRFGNLFPKPF
jgi:hypothetical protein